MASPTDNQVVSRVREAAKRILGAGKPNRKEPISTDVLKDIVDSVDLSNILHLRPSTSNYNDTLYYYLLQDLSIRRKTRDRAERQVYTTTTVRWRPEKTCRKKPRGEKILQEIWVGTMAQTLSSPSYEATNFQRVYPR